MSAHFATSSRHLAVLPVHIATNQDSTSAYSAAHSRNLVLSPLYVVIDHGATSAHFAVSSRNLVVLPLHAATVYGATSAHFVTNSENLAISLLYAATDRGFVVVSPLAATRNKTKPAGIHLYVTRSCPNSFKAAKKVLPSPNLVGKRSKKPKIGSEGSWTHPKVNLAKDLEKLAPT